MARTRKLETAVRRAFTNACMIYEELASTLTDLIMRLRREGDEGRPLDKSELETIKAHQKAVLMVLDFEVQLFKQRLVAVPEGGRALDLGAARAEVAQRLARLADGDPA